MVNHSERHQSCCGGIIRIKIFTKLFITQRIAQIVAMGLRWLCIAPLINKSKFLLGMKLSLLRSLQKSISNS